MPETLLQQYKNAAVAHGEGTCGGDSAKANQAHDSLTRLLGEISATGSDPELVALFDDENEWVQLWAATHTLEVDEPKAAAKLQAIADAGIPIASMTARYTLQEWQNGSISFRN